MMNRLEEDGERSLTKQVKLEKKTVFVAQLGRSETPMVLVRGGGSWGTLRTDRLRFNYISG